VLPAIRTFRNTDVAALCKVWNAHFGDLGFDCRLNPLQLELICLAKPYFIAQDLLIAEYDQQIVGFLHLGPVGRSDLMDVQPDVMAIAALCIVPCDSEGQVAQALLQRAEQAMRGRSIRVCRFKPMLPECPFYQGLGPADSMVGATTSERRSCAWVTEAGFVPVLPTTQWELDLTNFQPPIDRQQLQIRRSSIVERETDEPPMPWWQACLLGHAEPVLYRLLQRTPPLPLCEALYWTVATELQTSATSTTWLWTPALPVDESGAAQLTFLLGETCRQLQSERLELVRTATPASHTQVNTLLRRLGFVAEQSGMVFEKLLA
jgi:hypothetical protein